MNYENQYYFEYVRKNSQNTSKFYPHQSKIIIERRKNVQIENKPLNVTKTVFLKDMNIFI